MSNQLLEMTEKLVSELEQFLSQFESASSYLSLFKVSLDISSTRIRFLPALSEIETTFLSILEDLIDSFKGIPRIETKLFTSLKETGLILSSMDMDSSRINQGQYIRMIATRNVVGAQRHLLSYDKYQQILSMAYDKKIDEFLEVPHSLSDCELEIQNLNTIASEINDHPNKIWMSMLYLDCEELNNGLKERTKKLICKINDSVAESQRKSSQQ